MLAEIKVPVLPESVSEGTLGSWHKQVGESVKKDEPIVDLETDKVVLEIVATADGVLESINMQEGDIVTNDQVLGTIKSVQQAEPAKKVKKPTSESNQPASEKTDHTTADGNAKSPNKAGPAVRKMLKESSLEIDEVAATGKKNSVSKADVNRHLDSQKAAKSEPRPEPQATRSHARNESQTVANTQDKAVQSEILQSVPEVDTGVLDNRNDRRVPMSRLRRVIADRLKQAQNTAAILTTFNEVDLHAVMALRSSYKDAFAKRYGVKLGMMSFFSKAAIEALKRFPSVNASIDGSDIVYHDYFDIGIAVSSERGLVVPILRDVDKMSYADIELQIRQLAESARNGKLGLDDLTGGTFSITNGGVFGSMLSTPILNPPQSAILGMHTIQQRPVVVDGEIVIRPMMYLALSYDHRIIDGREAVQFLVTIKQVLEDPARLMLAI